MNRHLLVTLLFTLVFAAVGFAQPANDNCADADVLPGPGMYNFTTIDATTDGPDHPSNCSSSGGTVISVYNDIWYSFTPTWTGYAIWSLCSTADFDTKIMVYNAGAACPVMDGQVLACNEDGAGCTGYTSEVIFPVTSGSTYLLRLGGWGDAPPGESGSGSFIIEEYIFNGPPNDDCADAIEIFMDADDSITVVMTNVDATTDGPLGLQGHGCFGTNGEESDYSNVWYKWTATYTGGLDVSASGTVSFESRFSVYGPGASSIPSVDLLDGCSDDGLDENFIACPDYTSHDRFWVEQGGTYLISIGGWSASDVGAGYFTFKKADIYTPPANDNCADAESVFIMTPLQADQFDYLFNGNNQTASYTDSVAMPTCRPTGEFWDVWYSFNSGFNDSIELRFKINDAALESDYIIDLFSDCGTPDTSAATFCIRTDQGVGDFQTYQLHNFLGVPTQYLMRVSSRILSNLPGDFFFQLVGQPYLNSVGEPALTSFRLFPNPVHQQVSIDFGLPASAWGHWEIQNLLGQPIYASAEMQFAAGQNRLDYPVAKLPAGVYFFRLTVDGKEKTARFVKQ
ncbi:MAG: T9SS type A sorting domain-containing protein [Saprospiraceae bacterium]|nr:T9SS type A sorting domain-containing protein [Saprospiraceae bacterium]